MAVAVVAFFEKSQIFKEFDMGQKKTMLISLLVQLLLAAAVVVGLYSAFSAKLDPTRIEYSMYAQATDAWTVRCWHDAMFSGALLWLGFGGMMFVAATDFFDIFGYAFSSLFVLFSPLKSPKEHKHFYEYKQERADKRKKKEEERKTGNLVPLTMLIVGVLLLAGSLALLLVHDSALPEDAFHLTDVYDADQAENDLEIVLPDETGMTEETTGGENHE